MTATLLERPAVPDLQLKGLGHVFAPGTSDDEVAWTMSTYDSLILEGVDAMQRGETRKWLAKYRNTVPFEMLRHALGLVTTLRNAQLDAITSAIGTSGLLRIYDGSRPATGGTATTLLAQLALSATAAPAASGGVLTFNSISNDSSADATGTATWHRFATSGGSAVVDGSTGTSGADLNFNTVSFVAGAVISVTAYTITAGNA